MARSKDNVLTHGMSGKLGDVIVFRNVNGNTIVAKAPSKPKGEISEKQQLQRERFQEAVIYGKSVKLNPELKALYESSLLEGQNIYQVALTDFLNAPTIKNVETNDYSGYAGGNIIMRVIDNFMVKQVQVSINNTNGGTLEQGMATLQPNGLDWHYTTTSDSSGKVGKIIITATDNPGNISRKEISF